MESITLCLCLCRLLARSICSARFTDHGTFLCSLVICNSHLIVCRVKDWIHGVRAAAPEKETRTALEADPLYEAERLRIIYQLITNSPSEGGAGITPKQGEWENVESIFALHDHEANKKWMTKWSTSYFLTAQDLDDIRDRLGEKVKLHSPGSDSG